MTTRALPRDSKAARLLLAGVLIGSVALVGACSQTETTRTTTTEQTTHEIVPSAPASTSVTTTRTQVYTP
jgi:hypothetical protein